MNLTKPPPKKNITLIMELYSANLISINQAFSLMEYSFKEKIHLFIYKCIITYRRLFNNV